MALEMFVVQEFKEIATRRFTVHGNLLWRGEVRDRLVCVEGGALVNRGQKSAVPVVRTDLRDAARIRDSDERGQIAALAHERLTDPRTHARETIEGEAGGHLVFGGTVRVRLRRHRVDEANVVGRSGEVR